jgi:hypothetical protein
MLIPSSMRRLCAPLAVALLLPLSAHAQETVLGTWNGRVDREVQLTIRGTNVSSSTLSGQQLNGRFRLARPLPQQDGTVRAEATSGRGDVSVLQQPSSSNGYTAIIKMTDRSRGADRYRVTTYWAPATTVMPGRGGMVRGRGAVLRWSGDVDADADIHWRAGNVTQRNLNANIVRNPSSSVTGNVVVNRPGQITVNMRAGRGTVEVVQQPDANNRWTAVIRIHDPQSGYGHYELDAFWR